MADETYKDNKKSGNLSEMVESKITESFTPGGIGEVDEYVIPEELFETPQMGDFYLGAVDTDFFRKLDEIVRSYDTDKEKGDAEKAAFYTETPFPLKNKKLPKNTYFVKGTLNLSDKVQELGLVSGSDIIVDADSITPVEGFEQDIAKLKETIFPNQESSVDNPYPFIQFSMYGIASAAMPKWCIQKPKSSELYTKKVKLKDAASCGVRYPKGFYSGDVDIEYIEFESLNGKIEKYGNSDEVRICYSSGSANGTSAKEAQELLIKALNGQTEVYLLIDETENREIKVSDNMSAMLWKDEQYQSSKIDEKVSMWSYRHIQKNTRRNMTVGSAYIKVEDKWINLAKLIIASAKGREVTSIDYVSSKEFQTEYDPKKHRYTDAFKTVLDEIDDRPEIQKKIFNKEYDELKQWTVMIGDVCLFIPPTQISIITQIEDERIPILRSKGSLSKNGRQSYQQLSMEVYFYNEEGINGYPYEAETPNGTKITYYMNGLRALVSQFKFAPFLPIENDYINNTLGIDAVTCNSINIVSVVSNGPRLYKAEILLTEFQYSAYIPEHISQCISADISENFFAKAFNWGVFRYYYQRALILGNEIISKNLVFNSKEYLSLTTKNRTALQPMKFRSSKLDLYIPDEEMLDDLLEKKREEERQKLTQSKLSKEDNMYLAYLKDVNDNLVNLFMSPDLKKGLTDSAKELENSQIYDPTSGDDRSKAAFLAMMKTTATTLSVSVNDILKNASFISMLKEGENANVAGNSYSLIANGGISSDKNSVTFSDDKKKMFIKASVMVKMNGLESTEDRLHLNRIKSVGAKAMNKRPNAFFTHTIDGTSTIDDSTEMVAKIDVIYEYKLLDATKKEYKFSGKVPVIDTMSPDLQMISWAAKKYEQNVQKGLGKYGVNGEMNGDGKEDWRENPTIFAMENLKYNKVNIGEFQITDFSVGLSNRVARINLIDVPGACSQYLGGEDIVYNLEIMTQDAETVKALIDLPKQAEVYTKRYREILPNYPLRIDSELSRLFGSQEVMIDNVKCDTIPNQPGVYSIYLSVKTVDRTMRSKESLKMLALQNQGITYNPTDFSFQESKEYQQKGLRDIQAYMDLKDTLGKMELYPDLELPLIVELEDLGYNFLRYKFQDSRIYVDPDFYFLYLAKLSSQLTRETIIESLKAGASGNSYLRGYESKDNKTYELHNGKDHENPEIKFEVATNEGFRVVAKNRIAEEQQAYVDKIRNSKKDLSEEVKKENIREKRNPMGDTPLDSWKVGKKIQVSFLEKKYRDELRKLLEEEKKEKDKAKAESKPEDKKDEEEKDATKNQDEAEVKDINEKKDKTAEEVKKDEKAAGDIIYSLDGNSAQAKEKLAWVKDSIKPVISYARDFKKWLQETPIPAPIDPSTKAPVIKEKLDKTKPINTTPYPEVEEKKDEITYQNKYPKKTLYDDYQAIIDEGKRLKKNLGKEKDPDKYRENHRLSKRMEGANFALNDIAGNYEKFKGPYEVKNDVLFKGRIPFTSIDFSAENLKVKSDKDSLDYTYKNVEKLKQDALLTLHKKVKEEIYAEVKKFLDITEVVVFLGNLNIGYDNPEFVKTVQSIVYSLACGSTGKKDYRGQMDSIDWRPDIEYHGTRIGGSQDKTTKTFTNGTVDLQLNAIEFGIFKIKMYNSDQLLKLTGEAGKDYWPNEPRSVNTNYWLLDPYYRKSDQNTIEAYKLYCGYDIAYCTHAFMRLIMYWLTKCVDNLYFPSISLDKLRHSANNMSEIMMELKKESVSNSEDKEILSRLQFFKRNSPRIDAGKIWTAGILALTDGSAIISDKIEKRQYSALSSYVSSLIVPSLQVPKDNTVSTSMRRTLLALSAEGIIKDNIFKDNIPQKNETYSQARDISEKKYLAAAENPAEFMMHACHDMVVHDARGRMLRAFPTFFMCFVDEGRQYSSYKLHDNLYTTGAIMEMDIVKSRKIPADFATIKISNAYCSYVTDEPGLEGEVVVDSTWNTIKSMVFESDYARERLEVANQMKEMESRVRLAPGIRLHIRMGFGANPNLLPIVFNGVIAEVTAEETVDIIAQGDGIEISKPILEENTFDVQTQDKVLDAIARNGGTPKEIMDAFLTNVGGVFKEAARKTVWGGMFEPSSYGLSHFGDPELNVIEKKGEPTQNIYEAYAYNDWLNSKGTEIKEPPSIRFDCLGKTGWDLAHQSKSLTPGYIVGVAPFNLRSTLFIGYPRYYYAYDYLNVNGALHERRKPYQQYHILTSYSDIVGNGMTATSENLKTCVLGLYKIPTMGMDLQSRVGPIFIDKDIYPENQKTMVLNTEYVGKGVPYVSGLTEKLSSLFADFLHIKADDEGKSVNHGKIAARICTSALRESAMEMYAGEIVSLGNPAIKPHDRIYIYDEYEDINGQVLAREVTHHLSVEEGFITTIVPDCVVTDKTDKFEFSIQNWFQRIGSITATAIALDATLATLFAVRGIGLFSLPSISGIASTAGELVGGAGRATAGAVKGNGIFKELKTIVNDSVKASKGAMKVIRGGSAAGRVFQPLTFAKTAKTIFSLAAARVGIYGLVVTFVLGKITNLLSEMAINDEAVRVFPVRHRNRVWTAGLGGSKGIIVGSPTEHEQGLLTHVVDEIVGGAEGSFSSNVCLDFLRGMLFDAEAIQSAKERLEREDPEKSTISGEKGEDQDYFKEAIRRKMNGEEEQFGDYRNIQCTPRVNITDKEGLKGAFERFAIKDADKFASDVKFGNVKFISEDKFLKKYIETGFFKIVQNVDTLTEGKQIESRQIRLKGTDYNVKYIVSEGPVYDMPLLNPDAICILQEIVRIAKNKMPTVVGTDKKEEYDKYASNYIILESALRAGDTKSYACTGFSFVLSGTGTGQSALEAAIIELKNKAEESSKKSEGYLNKDIFYTKDLGGGKIAITVAMPK